MAQSTLQTRLCPHCANSIALDALTCPYCKADLLHSLGPEWPGRNEDEESPPSLPVKEKLPVRSRVILVIGLLVFALGVYLVGGNRERSDMAPVLAEQQRVLQEKDEKIQNLEAQLAQLRRDHQGSTDEIAALKSKIAEGQKDLTTARAQLRDANREIDRKASSRTAAAQRPAPRNADPLPTPAAPSAARSRRGAEPGLYETMRATSVYEEPASSSRVMSQIAKGTQITVVRSAGDWLEIRSKHGNPSGFIRADDATFLSRAN
jgi:hypothetical protein